MRTGASISAVGHGILLLLLMFGGFDHFDDNQSEMDAVVAVELISDQELQVLLSDNSEMAEVEEDEVSVVEVKEDESEPPPEPDLPAAKVTEIEAEPVPVETNVEIPANEREVVSVAETETEIDEAARQDAERIAELAAPKPPEFAETSEEVLPPVETQETEPQVEATEVIEEEPVEPTVQEETATETVTEAEATEATASILTRPLRRPPRPAPPAVEPQEEVDEPDEEIVQVVEPEPVTSVPDETETLDIAALIAQVQNEADVLDDENTASVLAVQLTASEREGLRRMIQGCWNIGSLSDAAQRITVTIAVSLQKDGRPIPNSIKLLDASAGGEAATRRAFESGQRAILRCLNDGYVLPPEKYEGWRDVEIVFNPEEMRNR